MSLFSLALVLSVIGYSVQNALVVNFVRAHDELEISMYRTLSFFVTLSPLLFFVPKESFQNIPHVLPILAYSGFFGAVGVWMFYSSLRFLPFAVANSFSRASTVFLLLGISFFFKEYLSWSQIAAIGLILISTFFLALQKHHLSHLDARTGKGILTALTGGVIIGFSFYFMGDLGKQTHPFFAGYAWECSIGLFSLLLYSIRIFYKKEYFRFSFSQFIKVALCASPTLLGTGGFAYALTIGNAAVASAIGSLGIIVNAILSYFLHNEKPNCEQSLGMFGILLGAILLQFMGF